ncbi:winged helix-turn-helix transcriptional regulator [Cupriavidus basilensis]|jgi:DNA-binding HxlR family transcriptional regulator|uniref:winged helix-turn-helix transcriptional regulator n=1 Tax=unclassified Cupriavidus TaxID=2640874 RepID=UPI0004455081|nr:helix-turn-helix domain-containing protein [Cupriavidus sp. SK-3]KDP84896.1 HxlR family transcriptional regulator [Cupriavidus sp. SK-3]
MAHTDFASMPCPIARSMSVLGERWAILLLREAFYGSTRFDEFQRHLGIAPNILSARLKSLVEHGMLERLPAPDSARHVYHLTEKSRDFFPAFVALKAWADRWMNDACGPHTVLQDKRTGAAIAAPALARADGSPLTLDDLRVVPGPAASGALRRRLAREDDPAGPAKRETTDETESSHE